MWKLWGGKAARARDRWESCQAASIRSHWAVEGWPGHPALLPDVQKNGLGSQGTHTTLESQLKHTYQCVLRCSGNTSTPGQRGVDPLSVHQRVCAHVCICSYIHATRVPNLGTFFFEGLESARRSRTSLRESNFDHSVVEGTTASPLKIFLM